MAELRRLGFLAWKAERWNSFGKVSQDAFGFADILALGEAISGTFYVQCTSGVNHSARVKKVRANKAARLAVERGNQVEVWSWSKKGPRGKRKEWVLRRECITYAQNRSKASKLKAHGKSQTRGKKVPAYHPENDYNPQMDSLW